MSLQHLTQRVTSMNGIDIPDSENLRVPAGEIRAAVAEADTLRRERDELRRWKSAHAPRLDALEGLLHAAQAKAVAGGEAIATLASERAANSILTGEVDGLRNERDAALAELAQAREGAVAMREMAAQQCDLLGGPIDVPAPDQIWVAANAMAKAIRALPLPTGGRQAVLLTDEQIERGRKQVFSTGNPFCPCDAKTMSKAARWAEAAVLAANGLEVRRG